MLIGEHLTKDFGGLRAVDDVSFEVRQGEIVGLIGPNGAGKTTIFNIISGFYHPTKGSVFFKGQRIDGLRPHQVCKMGLSRTFQIVQTFASFTAFDTILLAALNRLPMSAARKRAREVLEIIGVASKADELVGNLTLPHQKALEIGKALACGPEIVLLDEMMAGLTPVEAEASMDMIRRLREDGITFFVVEHVMHIVMNLCERIIVINFGRKLAEGTPKEVSSNKAVIEAYLGEEIPVA